MSERIRLMLTASGVAEHFKHSCDRFSAYSIMSNPEIIGWSKKDNRPSASQAAGNLWEEDVLDIIGSRGEYCAKKPGTGDKIYDDWSVEESIERAVNRSDKAMYRMKKSH